MSSPSENNEPGRVDDLVGNVTAAALREMRLNSMSPSEPERPNASPLPVSFIIYASVGIL